MANQLSSIKHVVQLMLENRSFDQMLGFLYTDAGNRSPTGDAYDGLTGDESNPDDTGREIKVFKIDKTADHPYLMPGADPGEGFHNTNFQLFSTDDPAPGAVPTNRGFVVNFKVGDRVGPRPALQGHAARHRAVARSWGCMRPRCCRSCRRWRRAMRCATSWFASAPTQTIPNRAFAGAATSQGHLDNHVKVFTCPSIFGRLQDKDVDWAIYGYNRDPLTRLDFTDTQHAGREPFRPLPRLPGARCGGHAAGLHLPRAELRRRAATASIPITTWRPGEQLIHDVYRRAARRAGLERHAAADHL